MHLLQIHAYLMGKIPSSDICACMCVCVCVTLTHTVPSLCSQGCITGETPT